MNEAAHVAALASLEGAGPARVAWLLSCGSPTEVWAKLRAGTLRATDGHGAPGPVPAMAAVLARWRREAAPDAPARMAERLERLGVEVLTGDTVPARLAAVPDPAPVVFCRGSLPVEGTPAVAVVGTRRASAYGLRMAEELGAGLAEAGVSVVSGLALGIDAAAHRGALSGTAAPVAVIGAAHDRPCPQRNRSLAGVVLAAGAVVSEVPPGAPSAAWRYPARNRLIAALADVVVVVESASRGGSMLTVAEALARDRPVMAVPGAVGVESAAGCHDLLRDGAEICTGAADVLTLLGLSGVDLAGSPPARRETTGQEAASPADGNPAASLLLGQLAGGPLPVDVLMERVGLGFAELAAELSELERAGAVVRAGGLVERR